MGKRRVAPSTSVVVNDCVIFTWNIQGMSVKKNHRARMRRVAF